MAVTRAGGRSWKGALLVRNVKDADIQDLLQEYTSARVSVCLEQRVCPSNGANPLHFVFENTGEGLFRDRPKGGGACLENGQKGACLRNGKLRLIEARSPGPGKACERQVGRVWGLGRNPQL